MFVTLRPVGSTITVGSPNTFANVSWIDWSASVSIKSVSCQRPSRGGGASVPDASKAFDALVNSILVRRYAITRARGVGGANIVRSGNVVAVNLANPDARVPVLRPTIS